MTDTVTINIRLKAEEKVRLVETAAISGQTLSSFLREAAILRARRILAEFEPHLVQP